MYGVYPPLVTAGTGRINGGGGVASEAAMVAAALSFCLLPPLPRFKGLNFVVVKLFLLALVSGSSSSRVG